MPIGSEIRQAVRGLVRSPALSLAAILCLGVGIGATTAIYSAVHTALIRPLPYTDPDRLVTVYRTTPHFDTGPFSPANFLDLRRETRSLVRLTAIQSATALLQGAGEAARITAYQASDGLFDMLGVRPLLGRLLRDGDEDPANPAVVVLTEEIWRDRFGSDAGIVGTVVRIDGAPYEVVGVLPRGFRALSGQSVLESDVWVPLRFSPERALLRRNNSLRLLGRLAGGATVESAHMELRAVMEGIVEAHPELSGEQVRVVPLHAESVRSVRGPLIMLFGAVGFVLLIAVANVASLLLARGVARRGEFAMRTVLGARQSAAMRPALVESAVLAFTGTTLGLALSWAGVRVIRALVPGQLPQLQTLSIDGGVLLFAVLLTAIVAITCGVTPAWQAARAEPQDALRASGRTGRGLGHQRFLRALVAVEVALSLLLLLGAGLAVRGFQRLVDQDPGFDPRPLLSLTVNIPPDRYADGSTTERFLVPALDAVRALPGVVEAGAISLIPYTNWGWNFNVSYEGRANDDPTRLPLVETRTVTPGLFAALGLELVGGRLPTAADASPDAPLVVVVNEALVRRDFPNEDPIGKRFHSGPTTFATIVGVVRDIRNFGPDRDPRPEVMWSYGRTEARSTSFPLLVRVSGDPASMAPAVTAALRSVDGEVAISGLRPMTDVIAQSVGRPRFYLVLMSVFAAVALLLATAGLYGVMSYAVAQRSRELGIRSALGSTPGRTLAMVLRQGFALIGLGAAVGLTAGAGLTRFLESLLYGVSPLDGVTFAAVTAALAAAGTVAILLPARRAATVDPVVAMRTD